MTRIPATAPEDVGGLPGEAPGGPSSPDADPSVVAEVQQWRRRVVRGWIATMITALAIGAGAAIWPMTLSLEVAAAVALCALAAYAAWQTRQGRCPRCSAPIRFEPRIELPAACGHCGIAFSAGKSG